MKILEIGPNIKPQAKFIPGWEGAEIVTMDAIEELHPDILCDAGDPPEELYGTFDGVFASHVLEHFSYWYSETILEKWSKLLVPGGTLHIIVPSLEWAAREVLSEMPTAAVLCHLYGGMVNAYDVHLAAFTLRRLRVLFDKVGLDVFAARTGPYTIIVQEVPHKAEQHYIAGRRPTGQPREVAKE